MNPTLNNPFNGMLQGHRENLARANRTAMVPGNCASLQTATGSTLGEAARKQRKHLLQLPINVFQAGDNQLIPTLQGKKLIYEIVLWNSTAQTLRLFQGPSATGILLLQLTAFPATTGFILGFNGSWRMPHFEVDSGQPFVLNLASAAQVDGMIRYRITSGSD